MLNNTQNYYKFTELVQTGTMHLNVQDITKNNWNDYYEGLLNIIRDGIETPQVQNYFVEVNFGDGDIVSLSVFDLYFNLVFWYLPLYTNQKLNGKALFFPDALTQDYIKDYLDKYISVVQDKIPVVELNNVIDDTLHRIFDLEEFSFFLCNTINLKDTIDLMRNNEEFNDLIHTSLDTVRIEDIKSEGMKKANRSIEIINDSEKILGHEHCLKNSFVTKEGINPRQYKEFAIHIGTKPNGSGGVHPYNIDKSYIMAGLDNVAAQFGDSASSRYAQIQTKRNTGTSGSFARIIGINCMDSFIHPELDFMCNTHNFQEIVVENEKFLKMLLGRTYRFEPEGIDMCIGPKDTFLIGKKILLFSPMTCASAAHGNGICRRCYGNLAYINKNIRVGKFAAEQLSAQLTQKQLSAKHLLETIIEKYHWTDVFNSYFDININTISVKENNKGGCILINPETIYSKAEDEDMEGAAHDANEFDKYIIEFTIIDKKGSEHIIRAQEDVDMYFSPEFLRYVTTKAEITDDGYYYMDLADLVYDDMPMNLFFFQIVNNDIGKNLQDIENLINRKTSLERIGFDKNVMQQRLIQLIIQGKITIQSVHLEVILMNQIRSARTKLRTPDWTNYDEEYQLLSLDQALKDNPSIISSLIYQNLDSVLTNPSSFEKKKPSKADLFFMKQPQSFLSSYMRPKKKKELIKPVYMIPRKK